MKTPIRAILIAAFAVVGLVLWQTHDSSPGEIARRDASAKALLQYSMEQQGPRYGKLDKQSWPEHLQRELNVLMRAGHPGVCVLGRITTDGFLRFEELLGATPNMGPSDCPQPQTVALVFFAPSQPPSHEFMLRVLKNKLDLFPFAAHVAVFWEIGDGEGPCWCGPARGHGLSRVHPSFVPEGMSEA